MRIERTSVTKLLISDLIATQHKLDPVTVFLEDLGPNNSGSDPTRISRRGKIIIECYGKSWSSYWGAMGDRKLAHFFCDCSADYLIGCLSPQLNSSRFNGYALVALAKKTIILRRQGWKNRDLQFSCLDKEQSRRLFDAADELSGTDTLEQAINWHGELLEEIFDTAEPWHCASSATEPNPDYQYLCRIIAAVQEALGCINQQVAA
nr:hypothetical protein [uncultured Pseudomonas sp.]